MTIFYADDDAEEILFFCEAIKAVDDTITCITSTDGHEALKLLLSMPAPDFIFLDLNMPKVNGKTCMLRLKEDERLKHIPIIIYSTLTTPRMAQQLVKLGAQQCLGKQTNIVELCDELRSILLKEVSK
jgi:CheY-like chemotaxis protein